MADPALIAELERAAGGMAIPFFVEVNHDELVEPIRLVLDEADYFFEGETWYKSAFDIAPPADNDAPPETAFRFPNIDRRRTAKLTEINGPMSVSFRLFHASWFNLHKEPRVVKAGKTPVAAMEVYDLQLIDASGSPTEVKGRLIGIDYRSEAVPARRGVQSIFPGAFYS